MRQTYRLNVYRDHRWWMVYVPKIDQITQADHLGEVELMGRDLIGIWLDIDPDSFDVDIHIEPPPSVKAKLDQAQQAEQAARAATANAAMSRREAVRQLRQVYGLSVKETARLLGLSRGRIYQLLDSADHSGQPMAPDWALFDDALDGPAHSTKRQGQIPDWALEDAEIAPCVPGSEETSQAELPG